MTVQFYAWPRVTSSLAHDRHKHHSLPTSQVKVDLTSRLMFDYLQSYSVSVLIYFVASASATVLSFGMNFLLVLILVVAMASGLPQSPSEHASGTKYVEQQYYSIDVTFHRHDVDNNKNWI